jgi:hypothetical protein
LKPQSLLSILVPLLFLSQFTYASINPNIYFEKPNKLSQTVSGLYGGAGGLSTYQLLNLEEPVTLGAMAMPLANIAKVRNAGATVTFVNDGKVAVVGSKDDDIMLPGLERPIRPINSDFPPNQSVANAMNSESMIKYINCSGTDCSKIAEKLLKTANGQGKILEIRPAQQGQLKVYEGSNKNLEIYSYHQVYTDGKYVYDPRLSSSPIPKGDWEQHIKGINPDGIVISDKPKGF